MFGWLISQIPWWVPVVVAIIVAIFCWQWIAPLWFMLPRWAQITIAFVAAIFVAMQYGRNRGDAAAQARRKQLNERAVQQRDAIDDKVRNMSPNAVTRALERNGWMRD